MRTSAVVRALTAGAVALGLSACSFAPLPHTVDLRAQLDDPAGEVTVDIGAGAVEDLDLLVPTDTGECFVFDDVAPGLRVHSAQLQWIVDVSYGGPSLTGKVQARAYAAGVGEDVFDPSHTVGPAVTVDLSKTEKRLAGAADLSPEQLEAINERALCWGAHLRGQDVSAAEDGTATVRYEVERLRLRITFSVL